MLHIHSTICSLLVCNWKKKYITAIYKLSEERKKNSMQSKLGHPKLLAISICAAAGDTCLGI